MPKYEFALLVTIETKRIVMEAKNQDDLKQKVEDINLMVLLQQHSYGLVVNFADSPKRVFDTVSVTFGKEECHQLPQAGSDSDICKYCALPRGMHAQQTHLFEAKEAENG